MSSDAVFDEDGVREVNQVRASDARRRERERAERGAVHQRQDALRGAFATGQLTMAEYAKQAREAGIAASEVAAALQERASAERRMATKAEAAKNAAHESFVAIDGLLASTSPKTFVIFSLA